MSVMYNRGFALNLCVLYSLLTSIIQLKLTFLTDLIDSDQKKIYSCLKSIIAVS